MKIRGRYTWQYLLAALLVVPVASLRAQAVQPAVVISVASVDEQFADARYLMRAAGLDQFLEIIDAGQGFAQGVDSTRPIGAYLTVSGMSPEVVGFVGVTDLDSVLALIAGQVGPAQDVEGGLKKVSVSDQSIFIKEQNGWAFFANSSELLANPPADPVAVLGGLNNDYNVAIQVNVQNIPAELRDMAVFYVRQQFEQSLQQELADDTVELKEMRAKASRAMMANLEQAVRQMDQYTIAWGVDDTSKSTFIDMTATAVAGSELANRIANQSTASKFTGFLLPDAAMNMNMAANLAQEDVEYTLSLVQLMRSQAMNELDADTNLNDDERAAAKEVLGGFIDVLYDTIESGRMDGGAALLLAPAGLTFAAGGHVADGKALDGLLRRVAELAKDEPDFPGISFGADSHGDVQFHTMRFPMPPGNEEARAVLGDELEVAFGIGGQSAFLAFGRDSVQTLKNVIDKSAQGAERELPVMQLNVALSPIMAFAAAFSEDATVAGLAAAMQAVDGSDKIVITGRAIPNGQTSRIELQEGAIRAIGESVKFFMAQ